MSYLDAPRLHFFGRFYTDPSTANNIRTNFDTENPAPIWNPSGTHFFRFQDCVISSARGLDGNLVMLHSQDPVVGAPVLSAEDRGVAKLVDLDTDQQGISTIFGHRISLDVSPGVVLTGDMATAQANGLWICVVPQVAFGVGGGNMEGAAYYQTTLAIPDASWPAVSGSAILDQLRSASDVVDGKRMLSLRFNLDAFMDIPGPNYKTGRIVGTFGPGKAVEPAHCPARRTLIQRQPPGETRPPWNFYTFNRAAFTVDSLRQKLVIDIGNSMPRLTVGGPPPNIGQLNAQIAPPGQPPVVIGPVDYSEATRNVCAGVVELDLTPAQISLLESNPLQLVATAINLGSPVVLAEAPDGLDFAAEDRGFRMAFDAAGHQQRTTPVYVRRFGKPVAGEQLALQMLASGFPAPGQQPALPDASNCLSFSITPTDASGAATLTLTAVADPGKPADRPGNLDGQVYRIGIFATPPATQQGRSQPQEVTVSVHLYASFTVPAHPLWKDVLALMAPYKPLYPGMFSLLDLTDENAFTGAREQIIARMTAPFDSPGYMPVTRDLSPNKLETILQFCRGLQVRAPVRIASASVAAVQPYVLTFELVKYPTAQPALPALQSFVSTVSPTTGEWVILGGLTGGAHSFTADSYSHYIYVVNPVSGAFYSFDVDQLPDNLRMALRCDNAQLAHEPGTKVAYLFGGFGVDKATKQLVTLDTVTAFVVDDLIAAVKKPTTGKQSQAASLFKQSTDPRLAVAGGGLVNKDGAFYLMMGHKFRSSIADPVSPTALQEYTEEIRHFRMDPARPGIVDSSYGTIVDPGDHSFHRRDLCVAPGFNPDTGEQRVAAFAGVFRFGKLQAFTTPLFVDDQNSAGEDTRFQQKMNLYECPVIPAYDETTKTMSYTFFGGIAGWKLDSGGQVAQDPNMPWSNQAAMVIQTPGGRFTEIVLTDAIPGGLCVGADAKFHFVRSLWAGGRMYPNGVLKLHAFAPGEKALLGYIYGGIEAATPDTPSASTTASNRVFAVYLTNVPVPGVVVS